VVSDQYVFEFHTQAYAPSRDYDGRFGVFDFRKHFYGRIGDFDSKEEFECACHLDMLAQQGRIQFWVRNLVRRVKAARSSCRRQMGASTRISSASCRA
jgi:type III restriction enzyme